MNFGYNFNTEGKLVDEKGDRFCFTTQANYEQLGEWITQRIHGSGCVRAGQWARSLIINDSLTTGTQLPYIKKCIDLGYAILVMNTNDNYYNDTEGQVQKVEGCETAIKHGCTTFKEFVSGSEHFKNIAIVAHSFGGQVAKKILQIFDTTSVKALCLTDSLNLNLDCLENGPSVKHWMCSTLPLDTEINVDASKKLIEVSAGTTQHEKSSAMAIESVFKFIHEKFNPLLYK